MHKIFALVGPSGAGKTRLILECIKRLGGEIASLPCFTTRPRRGPDDDPFYVFVSEEEIRRQEVFATFEYGGYLYASTHRVPRAILSDRPAICALTEQGVLNHRGAGYEVITIHVIPSGEWDARSLERARADTAREGSIPYDHQIVNNFAPGGFEQAIRQLIEIISIPIP